ncbi:MAG: hypothetical protein V4628_14485 [Pseudomonadota bacterium]
MKSTAVTPLIAADALREFLLGSAIQQQTSEHAGAVAGTVSQGSVFYVYGEITGYYLHWLASLDNTDPRIFARAQAATNWLEKYLQGEKMPATRIYFDPTVDDWRNKALFAFDLAMIAGGLARAEVKGLISVPDTLSKPLIGWLQHFVDGPHLKACIVDDKTMTLPARWSTQGGSFTAKTASRILLLARRAAVEPTLLDACRQTLASYALAAEKNGLDMLHPTLYAIEGCLLAPDADYERLALWFDQIVSLQAPDGSLPESLQTPDIRRTDIIAQALRVSVFLQKLTGQPSRYQQANLKFATALCTRVRENGGIGFTPDKVGEDNTWCAMFAEQALRLYAADTTGQPLPFAVEDIA